MPFLAEAEAEVAYEEGRSILGSFITQLIAITRQLIKWVINVVSQIVKWAGENPLAMTLVVANFCIWVS
jgi:hypothetical protein